MAAGPHPSACSDHHAARVAAVPGLDAGVGLRRAGGTRHLAGRCGRPTRHAADAATLNGPIRSGGDRCVGMYDAGRRRACDRQPNQSASSDAAAPVLKHLALRLDIVGRTPIAPQIEEITRHLVDDLALNEQGVSVEINRMRISVLPEVDLESYASTNTAPGAVARLLLALEQSEPSEEAAQLIEQARRQLMGVDEHRAFSTLPRPEISVEVAREYVRDQARALLNKLVEQSP